MQCGVLNRRRQLAIERSDAERGGTVHSGESLRGATDLARARQEGEQVTVALVERAPDDGCHAGLEAFLPAIGR